MIFKGGIDTNALINAGASMLMMTRHVLRDVAGEFKRIAKARRERKAGISTGTPAEEGDSVEDLADALESRGQIARLMLGAPWVGLVANFFLGPPSLFVLPGASAPVIALSARRASQILPRFMPFSFSQRCLPPNLLHCPRSAARRPGRHRQGGWRLDR